MYLASIAIVILLAIVTAASAEQPAENQWVRIGADGKLQYHADELGNRIPDFSNCGYGGGGVPLPNVEIQFRLKPAEGDMTAALQQAIDHLGKMKANAAGIRGALLLERGHFHIGGTLHLHDSGVVLRGEGQGDDGTVLIANGTTKHNLFECEGSGSRGYDTHAAAQIVDEYVPVGADCFMVDDPSRVKIGQTVWVDRPATPEWLHAIGMDRIPPHRADDADKVDPEKVQQWDASYHLRFDRIITAIRGHQVRVDAPIVNAIERKFGGGTVVPYHFEGRIEHVGIENMRIDSAFVGTPQDNDEKHGWIAVDLTKIQNAWVRDVTSVHFGFGLVNIGRDAKWVTVQDCTCLDPVSEITGGRRYSFNIAGELSLVQRCNSREGRHDFALDSRVPGPNVFLNCTARNARDDAGPHHRWSTGTLFDNVETRVIDLQNRLNMGSGHGWSGANDVLWNCRVEEFRVQNPPTAHNWAIGVIGKQVPPSFMVNDEYRKHVPDTYFAEHPDPDPAWGFDGTNLGTLESIGHSVAPQNLYTAQLNERLAP